MAGKIKTPLKKTRTQLKVPVVETFGCEKLTQRVLPTKDLIRHILFLRQKHKSENDGKEPANLINIYEESKEELKHIWLKASIPVLSDQRILHKIKELHTSYKAIMRNRNRSSYEETFQTYKEKISVIFYIAACKCQVTEICRCAKEKKIPEKEKPFLHDQRTVRKMAIGHIDQQSTRKMKTKIERRHQLQLQMTPTRGQDNQGASTSRTPENEEVDQSSSNSSSTCSSDANSSNEDGEYKKLITSADCTTSKDHSKPTQARQKIGRVAETCDRFGISDRAGAAIASATLEEFGMININESFNVIERSKVRPERKRVRQEKSFEGDLEALYFDGRKDKAKVMVKVGEKFFHRTQVKEHVSHRRAIILRLGTQYTLKWNSQRYCYRNNIIPKGTNPHFPKNPRVFFFLHKLLIQSLCYNLV